MVFLGTVPLFKHFCEHLMAEEIYPSSTSLNDTNQASRLLIVCVTAAHTKQQNHTVNNNL